MNLNKLSLPSINCYTQGLNCQAMAEETKKRYSDEELREFEKIIDQKLAEARVQLNYYLKHIRSIQESTETTLKAYSENTIVRELNEYTTYAERMRKLIQHLEKAKLRIKNKTYGICRETGKLISKERLKAVPHATLSIEAKQKLSKR